MEKMDLNRRAFLKVKPPKVESNAIRPPWSIEASKFVDICERCDNCIDACPEKILFRGEGGYPEVNFKKGECTFCAECVDACEVKAFQYLKTGEEHDICAKPSTAWHLKVQIKENCLSLNAITCRVCGDNCDEQAIRFQLKVGGVSEPLIDQDKCTGCGACLYVCPDNAVAIENAA